VSSSLEVQDIISLCREAVSVLAIHIQESLSLPVQLGMPVVVLDVFVVVGVGEVFQEHGPDVFRAIHDVGAEIFCRSDR
jgi:hypothetical protein